MEIVDLDPGDDRLDEVLAVLVELRPHLNRAAFDQVYRAGHPQGLRFSAVWDGGRCRAVAGWRIVHSTNTLKKLYVDDLVTTAASRSAGHGRALLAELEARARAAGCRSFELDSGVQRFGAHRFYLRERMDIVAHHFAKDLTAPVEGAPGG